MAIAVSCGTCGGKFNAPDAARGRYGRCPKCQSEISIGVAAVASPPALPAVAESPVAVPAREVKPCEYCGEEVLTVARKCRHCGEMLGDAAEHGKKNGATDGRVQTIQATGKLFKAAQAVGVLFMILGFAWFLYGCVDEYGTVAVKNRRIATGGVGGSLGLLAYVIGRFSAWWFHG